MNRDSLPDMTSLEKLSQLPASRDHLHLSHFASPHLSHLSAFWHGAAPHRPQLSEHPVVSAMIDTASTAANNTRAILMFLPSFLDEV